MPGWKKKLLNNPLTLAAGLFASLIPVGGFTALESRPTGMMISSVQNHITTFDPDTTDTCTIEEANRTIYTQHHPTEEDVYSALVFNVKDIPAPSLPAIRKRAACIEKLSEGFDIVALQEAFNKNVNISGSAWQPSFIRESRLGFIFNLVIQDIFNSPGLILSAKDKEKMSMVKSVPFDTCNGWLSNASDCLASKGYQIAKFGNIHIINTHMDSGNSQKDREIRRGQIKKLKADLPDGPLLLMGDLNIHTNHPYDAETLQTFLDKTGLSLGFPTDMKDAGPDYVLARSVEIVDATLIPKSKMSDHDAIKIHFKLPKDTQPTRTAQSNKVQPL